MGLNHNTTFKWTCVGWSGKKKCNPGCTQSNKRPFYQQFTEEPFIALLWISSI